MKISGLIYIAIAAVLFAFGSISPGYANTSTGEGIYAQNEGGDATVEEKVEVTYPDSETDTGELASAAATCYGSTCAAKNPSTTGCSSDAYTVTSKSVTSIDAIKFTVQLRYSRTCRAFWARFVLAGDNFCGSGAVIQMQNSDTGSTATLNSTRTKDAHGCNFYTVMSNGVNKYARVRLRPYGQYIDSVYTPWTAWHKVI